MNYLCLDQFLVVQRPILHRAVPFGDRFGRSESGRLRKLQNVKKTSEPDEKYVVFDKHMHFFHNHWGRIKEVSGDLCSRVLGKLLSMKIKYFKLESKECLCTGDPRQD